MTTSNSASLTWNAPSGTPPFTYTVEYRVTSVGGVFTKFGTTNNVTAATVTGLQPSTKYDFQVTASNAAGAGPTSPVVQATTAAPSLTPGQVQGVSVVSPTNTSLTVVWQQPTTGGVVGSYTVQDRLHSGGSFVNVATVQVATPGVGSVTFGGQTVTITPSGVTQTNGFTQVIAFNGVIDAVTHDVIQIAVINGVLWQQANTGWYSETSNNDSWAGPTQNQPWRATITGLTKATQYDFQVFASNSAGGGAASSPPVTGTTTSTTGNGRFQVSGGLMLKPDGSRFKARGVNIPYLNWQENTNVVMGHVVDANAKPLVDIFKGINFVRFVAFQSIFQSSLATAANISFYVNALTNAGIVVMLDPHIFPGVLSGTDLDTVCNRVTDYSNTFINNPNVWMETQNEPAGVITEEVSRIYSAWRGTGNMNPVVIYIDPTNTQNLSQSTVASMSNVMFEIHYYGWTSGYSTDPTTLNNELRGFVNNLSGFQSLDGALPVGVYEFGACGFANSNEGGFDANGSWQDPNWDQVKANVYNSSDLAVGWAEWLINVPEMFFPFNPAPNQNIDALLNTAYDNSLSLNGQRLRDAIAAAAIATP